MGKREGGGGKEGGGREEGGGGGRKEEGGREGGRGKGLSQCTTAKSDNIIRLYEANGPSISLSQ